MMTMILLIQLNPKHWGRNFLGAKRPGGELTKGRNVHKSCKQYLVGELEHGCLTD